MVLFLILFESRSVKRGFTSHSYVPRSFILSRKKVTSLKNFFKKNYVLLLFFASALIVLAIAIASMSLMRNSATMTEETSQEKMVGLAQAAAFLVTAEELDEFVAPEDMALQEYLDVKDRIIWFNDNAGTEFTYYLRLLPEEDMYQFVIDNTPTNFTALEEAPVAREEAPDIALAGRANAVPLGSYSEGWEGYLTAFAPVYYADGSVSPYVAGVDVLDSHIRQAYDNMTLMSIVLIIAIVLVLVVSLVCMLLYQRKAKQSEAANESKTSFLSNMSHEMRTPLNAIIGMTEIAKTTDDPERIQYCLEKVDSAAIHLLGVINDVLDISRIEAGKFTLSPTEFKMSDMLQRVGSVVQFKAEEKDQHFTIQVDESVPSVLVADEQHLSQVITNLLSNAVKFTPEKGVITMRMKAEPVDSDKNTFESLALKVEIQDTGIGISEEQQKRLFASFQQADNSISRRFGGTGLGLAISKNIVESMGGTIWVQSQLGEGSTFGFTVYVQTSPSHTYDFDVDAESDGSVELTASDFSAVEKSIDIFTGKTILLAEDVAVNQEILIALLEDTGVVIETAEDGKQAVTLFEQDPDHYDVILMDIHMPIMDGYEATRTIRALTMPKAKAVPIIAMTANVFREDVEKCLAAGMNDHVGKPVDVAEIIAKLRKYLLDNE